MILTDEKNYKINLDNGTKGMVVSGKDLPGSEAYADGSIYRTGRFPSKDGDVTLNICTLADGTIVRGNCFARIDSDDPIVEARWTRVKSIEEI